MKSARLQLQVNMAPPGGLVLSEGVALAAVIVVVVLALGLLLWSFSRRRRIKDIRELLAALEELRAGHTQRRAQLDSASSLTLVADAVNRLGHELHARTAEAEGAAERWRALGDAARQSALITTDTDGDIRSFSAGATALFGWEEEEVLSRPAAVLFEDSAYRDLLPKLARRSLRQQGITSRTTLRRRDGSSFPAEVSVQMLQQASGEPKGFLMWVRDLSQQAELEQELRESERRYRSLVEGLSEGVIIVQQGQLVYVNGAAEELLGQSSRELLNTPLHERIATRDVMVVEERLAALERGPRGEQQELRCSLLGPDGHPSAEVRIKASAGEHAGAAAVLLLVRDETRERRVQVQLRHNEAMLDAVLEAAADGILVLSESRDGGVVQLSNQAFSDLLGLRPGQILGLTEPELLERMRVSGEAPRLVAELAASVPPGAVRREVISLGGPPLRELQISLGPLRSRTGERLGRMLACRDLTEQRLSEQQLQAQAEQLQLSKVELEQAYHRLNEMNAQLQARGEELDRLNQELLRMNEMKTDLLSNVSHELQTPLVSIRGYTEMTLMERLGPITEEQRYGLNLSLKNIDRLISMIDNLLAFTRTEPGLGNLKLTHFNLKPLVEEAIDLLRDKMEAKRLQLSVAIQGQDLSLYADRDKILQVFLNLLSNAIKYNHQEGRIGIAAAPGKPGYATVRVSDSGVGIPREELGRIFDRNYQVRRGGEKPEGSGIGLSIVRDILRLHGCTIHAESEEGRGAQFVFTLPLDEDQGEQDSAPDERAELEMPGSEVGSRSASHRAGLQQERATRATRVPRFRIIRRGVKS